MTETETGSSSQDSAEPTISPAPAGPLHLGGVSGIGRAITAPVRAVSRIFSSTATSSHPAFARTGAAVVDCGLYVKGARQPGEWDYAQALAAARKRDDAFVWLGLHEPTAADLDEIAERLRAG